MIEDKAFLISVYFNKPPVTKQSKKARLQLATTNLTSEKQLLSSVKIFGDNFYEEYDRQCTYIRSFLNMRSSPYNDNGLRLVPNNLFFVFAEFWNREVQVLEQIRDRLIQERQERIELMKKELGLLFDDRMYPSPVEFSSRFKWGYDILPLPEKGVLQQLTSIDHKEVMEKAQERISNAQRDVCERLLTVVKHFISTIENDRLKRAHGTTLTNIIDLLDIVPDLNLMEDQDLHNTTKELRSIIGDLDMRSLKNDPEMASVVADEMKQEIESIEQKMMTFV